MGRVNALGQYQSQVEEALPKERLDKKEAVSKALKELVHTHTSNPRVRPSIPQLELDRNWIAFMCLRTKR